MVYNKIEMLYEGKAKKIFTTQDPEYIIVHFKDDATAFNAQKKGTIEDKGALNNEITFLIYEHLAVKGIKTHFIQKLNVGKCIL